MANGSAEHEHEPAVAATTLSSSSTSTSTLPSLDALATSVAASATPYLQPFFDRAKSALPAQVVSKLEQASAATATYSHSFLGQVDTAAASLSEKLVEATATIKSAPELVKTKAAESSKYIRSHLPAVPSSLEQLKTLGASQLERLKSAATKLRANLPGSPAEVKLPLPEERVEQIRSAANKVLEALPKMPAFEWPKVDLSKYSGAELVKFGHSLLSKLTPYIEPYQSRISTLLTDYKVSEKAGELQKTAAEYYKLYKLDQVVPQFVGAMVTGETAAQG